MAEPFLAEIRLMSFNFAPRGWAMCNGQTLPMNQNQALFSRLGTLWGGNGQTTFALPDLRGRVPIHVGNGHVLGPPPLLDSGELKHTLTINELPPHTHPVMASQSDGDTQSPSGAVLAREVGNVYRLASGGIEAKNPAIISSVGGGEPHENMQPYLTLNFCIALQGVYPTPN